MEIMPFDQHGSVALPVACRPPRPSDARHLWRLARDSALEDNSSYAYALLCAHFPDTCIVAVERRALAGFVVGYRPPRAPDTMFVWQVAVAGPARGRGLGTDMIVQLLDREELADARFLEATVTPSNDASHRLFQAAARRLGAPFDVRPFFAADLFGEAEHEPEDLYRIGPFSHRTPPGRR